MLTSEIGQYVRSKKNEDSSAKRRANGPVKVIYTRRKHHKVGALTAGIGSVLELHGKPVRIATFSVHRKSVSPHQISSMRVRKRPLNLDAFVSEVRQAGNVELIQSDTDAGLADRKALRSDFVKIGKDIKYGFETFRKANLIVTD